MTYICPVCGKKVEFFKTKALDGQWVHVKCHKKYQQALKSDPLIQADHSNLVPKKEKTRVQMIPGIIACFLGFLIGQAMGGGLFALILAILGYFLADFVFNPSDKTEGSLDESAKSNEPNE